MRPRADEEDFPTSQLTPKVSQYSVRHQKKKEQEKYNVPKPNGDVSLKQRDGNFFEIINLGVDV